MVANKGPKIRLEQIEYQRSLVEAELNAVRLSKAYKMAKIRSNLAEAELNVIRLTKTYKITKALSVIKNKIKSDPMGLTKKAIHIVFREPKKLTHILRRVGRINFMAETVVNQNSKYQEWILLNEPDGAELELQRTQADMFDRKPLISIITPVFNPPVDVLEALIESVLEQTYSNFELYLGNFGDNKEVIELLEKYAKLDTRIKHQIFVENKGIGENSNQILKEVTGEYIALLDHDDTISPDALYENVKKINEGNYDFIYSDKDKIDVLGSRFDPLFKPQLSPEMMLNINYLTHFNIMRTSLVKKIGGWDPGTDGAQDWDLFLRILEVSTRVAHVPKILYHWRVIPSSTAMSIDTKPYALAGQRKAVDKYLKFNNVSAKTYHKKTELFLDWDSELLDKNPWVYIYFSNISNTLRAIHHVRKLTNNPKFIVLIESSINLSANSKAKLNELGGNIKSYKYKDSTLFDVIGKTLKGDIKKDHTVLFIQDVIRFPKSDWYKNLTGWLSIKDVAAASGRLVDKNDLIVDSGAIINKNQHYYPIFQNKPRCYPGYLGNAEWVRNLSILSSNFFATRISTMKEYNFLETKPKNPKLDDFFLWASKKYRLLMTPHVTASVYNGECLNKSHSLKLGVKDSGTFIDYFGNPNMSATDPLSLFSTEPSGNNCPTPQPSQSVDQYQHDATILANSFDITHEELEANFKLLNTKNTKPPESVAWFLPSFDAVYAGLMNIFGFANYLSEGKGLKTTVYILKNSSDASHEKKQAVHAYPGLKNATFVGIRPDQITAIKKHDIGIATQWATAYPLARTMDISRKCYFIQDNEVNFYPKGSISSLVSLSYKFGFMAIANTDGLLDMYRKNYGGDGIVVKSIVDLSSYVPRKNLHYIPKAPFKVFFYARPNMPRNAFELGIAGLKVLKKQLGSKVEIITAGAEWDASIYGVEGLFTNLGKIDYNAVPKLYRSVDAGLMFMFSGHPGVTASELMASGCPVVVNDYDDVTWRELYQHEKTCLITAPTASEVARNLQRCLEDTKLRKKLIMGGLAKTAGFYDGYRESLELAYDTITGKGTNK